MPHNVQDNFNRADQNPLTSPWTSFGGPSGGGPATSRAMCLNSNGYCPPSSAFQGGPTNGGFNGGFSIRLGDGAYIPGQDASATIRTIAPALATMKITQVQANTPSAGNATYSYINYVGLQDAASGVFVQMDIVVAGCANSGNNIDLVVTSVSGGPSSGSFVCANGTAVNESPGAATGTASSDSLCGLAVRVTPDFQNGIFTYIGTNNSRVGGVGPPGDKRVYVVELWEIVDGTYHGVSALPVFTSIPDVPGDLYELFASGTTITIQKNGSTLLTYTDVNGQRGGYPGLSGQALSNDAAANYPGNNGTNWGNWIADDGVAVVTNGWNAKAGEWFSGVALATPLGNYFTAISGLGLIALKNITGNPGTATANGTTIGTGIYTGRTWANDQASEVVIGTNNGFANTYYLLARSDSLGWSTGANSYYATAVINNGSSNGYAIGKWSAGTNTGLTNVSTGAVNAVAPGDVLRFQVQGTTLQLLKNGTVVASATDGSVAGGTPGFMLQQNEYITSWVGYEFAPASSGSAGRFWPSPAEIASVLKGDA